MTEPTTRYTLNSTSARVRKSVYMDRSTQERIEAQRQRMTPRPDFNACIEAAIAEWLARREGLEAEE